MHPTLQTTPPIPADDSQRWLAVARRDHAADEHFVYAVKTTGVYCRPSCPSRSARRENVSFYGDGAAAAAAGYRPCKRCRPDEPSQRERRAAAVARACRLIESSDERAGLDELAAVAQMSRFHFHRVFREITGVTPKAYAAARRAERARNALRLGERVTNVVYDAGYGASSRFYSDAAGRLGMTPSAYRDGGAGSRIRFAVGECTLGSILVAATEKGICSILLGEDPGALLRELQDRFPRAELVGDDPEFEGWVAQVVGLVEAPRRGLDLPLDVRGTAFQERVWEALRAIPPGRTASYAEIARALGQPSSARAVAQVCAANPIAVAIPCHRVVKSDGSLAGYRWGLARKRSLLERESA